VSAQILKSGGTTASDEEPPRKEGTFTWLIRVFQTSEDQVYKDAGHEVVLYLSFLKYSFIMYLIIWVIGGLPLLIIYIKESNSLSQTLQFDSMLERITIKSFQGVQANS